MMSEENKKLVSPIAIGIVITPIGTSIENDVSVVIQKDGKNCSGR
jgi:hypothetical protein